MGQGYNIFYAEPVTGKPLCHAPLSHKDGNWHIDISFTCYECHIHLIPFCKKTAFSVFEAKCHIDNKLSFPVTETAW